MFRKISDKKITNIVGKKVYIRNGYGYGFVSDKSLYDNEYLEIGFGRSISGHGDWGGGCSQVVDSVVKVIINRNFRIVDVDFCSFYNSRSSIRQERKAKTKLGSLKKGKTLVFKDLALKEAVNKLFTILPCRVHVGIDYYNSPHMVDYALKNFKDLEEKSLRVLKDRKENLNALVSGIVEGQPNTPELRQKVETVCNEYVKFHLDDLKKDISIKCDEENNTYEMMKEGKFALDFIPLTPFGKRLLASMEETNG